MNVSGAAGEEQNQKVEGQRIEEGREVTDELRLTTGPASERPDEFPSNRPAWSTGLPSIESAVIDGRRRAIYAGLSMNPTLREPDLLWIEPYRNRPVRNGDVVCLKSPEQNTNIVHRVVSVLRRETGDGGPKDEIRTRGDNSPRPDSWTLATDDLLGRVVAAQRGPRLRSVPGGRTGRAIAWSVRLRKSIWGVVGVVASEVYQGLARIGPFDFLLPSGLKPRLVCFSGRGAAIFKLLMGSRAVGRYDDRLNQWHVLRPFRLFVDTHSLPVSGLEAQTSESGVAGPECGVPRPEFKTDDIDEPR